MRAAPLPRTKYTINSKGPVHSELGLNHNIYTTTANGSKRNTSTKFRLISLINEIIIGFNEKRVDWFRFDEYNYDEN